MGLYLSELPEHSTPNKSDRSVRQDIIGPQGHTLLSKDPQRTYPHASQRFKVTKARISQLMKLAGVLPQNFVDYMEGCQDQTVIKRFSGKTLLFIAGLDSYNERQAMIDNIMEKIDI